MRRIDLNIHNYNSFLRSLIIQSIHLRIPYIHAQRTVDVVINASFAGLPPSNMMLCTPLHLLNAPSELKGMWSSP